MLFRRLLYLQNGISDFWAPPCPLLTLQHTLVGVRYLNGGEVGSRGSCIKVLFVFSSLIKVIIWLVVTNIKMVIITSLEVTPNWQGIYKDLFLEITQWL